MSTFGGGGNPEFEKLIQLATFIQTPDYLQRVKELRDLEASSKTAADNASETVAAAATAQKALDAREAEVKQREDKLASMEQAHLKRVAALSRALGEAR